MKGGERMNDTAKRLEDLERKVAALELQLSERPKAEEVMLAFRINAEGLERLLSPGLRKGSSC